ncbi:MAG: PDDEXK nuclease domain-containing protein [Saprospiraceae bacterium]
MEHKDYTLLLSKIKEQIQNAQIKATITANAHMLFLYWQLGIIIIENQHNKGWGAKIIPNLAKDLAKEFPQLKGFSERNLKYMKKFAEEYTIEIIQTYNQIQLKLKDTPPANATIAKLLQSNENEFVQQVAAQLQNTDNHVVTKVQQAAALIQEDLFLQSILAKLTWSHHLVLMDKLKHIGIRLWYMLNSLENGISRNILTMQIESQVFERQLNQKKINNFSNTLPPIQSDFANYLLKDPYIFDFVQAKQKADERNIEEQLTKQITKFLLELGQGFAFIGRQVKFEIGNQDFFTDLLFYHTQLHCYVVVELKARPFEPGDAAQLNFYVNVVNDKLKKAQDNDTIGILLCRGKNDLVAEYSLKGYKNAIGISDYQLSKLIPEELKSSLPQIEDLENELKNMENNDNS